MTAQALPQLRPLRVVEILDQAVHLYRRNFGKFVGIIAVVQIPIAILGLLVSLPQLTTLSQLQNPRPASQYYGPEEIFGPEFFATMGASCLLGIVALILVQGVATAALTQAIADHYLGQPASFVDAYRKIGKSWMRLVGTVLLAGLINLLLVIWFLVPCIGWTTGIGIFLFYNQAIIPLAIPVVVLEGQKGYSTIRRGWDLARRRFWWVTGFVAILYLFNQLVVGGPSYLISLLFQIAEGTLVESIGTANAFMIQTVSETLTSLFTGLLYLPLQLTCMTLLYFDLRVRTEGFDLALLADRAMGEKVDVDAIMAQAPPAESAGLVTWPELGYFAVLSLGVVAIGLIFYLLLGGLVLAALGTTGGF